MRVEADRELLERARLVKSVDSLLRRVLISPVQAVVLTRVVLSGSIVLVRISLVSSFLRIFLPEPSALLEYVSFELVVVGLRRNKDVVVPPVELFFLIILCDRVDDEVHHVDSSRSVGEGSDLGSSPVLDARVP